MRLLRGRVVVREDVSPSNILWTPEPGKRTVNTHRGVVLAVGAPAEAYPDIPVPHGFEVGDSVAFHFEHHEEARTRPWLDGKPAIWLTQQEVDGVYTCS